MANKGKIADRSKKVQPFEHLLKHKAEQRSKSVFFTCLPKKKICYAVLILVPKKYILEKFLFVFVCGITLPRNELLCQLFGGHI